MRIRIDGPGRQNRFFHEPPLKLSSEGAVPADIGMKPPKGGHLARCQRQNQEQVQDFEINSSGCFNPAQVARQATAIGHTKYTAN